MSNSFVTVEGRGIGLTEGGDIWYDTDSADSIRVTARSGWLVNGSESVTLTPSSGTVRRLSATSKLKEDDEHVCVFPCVKRDVHCRDIEISAVANPTNQVAMYAVPDTGTVVSASASQKVVKKGQHYWTSRLLPCSICGAPPPEPSFEDGYYEVVPERYEWIATGAGQTLGSSTWTGMMTKGEGQEIKFDVTGKRDACSQCTCHAAAIATADVYELSIERPDYLGLDMTDAMKGKYVKREATAHIEPEPAKSTNQWLNCGRCKFIGKTDGVSVTYGGNDKTGGSESYLKEPLTVFATAWNSEGQSASATCTTNFTVVAVDVCLKNWGEMMDEKNDTIIGSYVKRDGTGLIDGYPDLAEKAMIQCPAEIEVFPKNLPADEKVTLAFKDKNLIANNDPEVAKESYTVSAIKNKRFYLFDESGHVGKKNIEATHDASSAKDIVVYDVCCCTVTVYSDASVLWGHGFWTALETMYDGDPGHSFWKIDIDKAHKYLVPAPLQKYIGIPYGFYPNATSRAGDKSHDFYDVPGRLDEDDDHFGNVTKGKPGTISHTWHISLEGCLNGLAMVKSLEARKYDLACFNCTDAAVIVGRACGAPVPRGGMPDDSLIETYRGLVKNNLNWASGFVNIFSGMSDGSYSSPWLFYWSLRLYNAVYGEIE